jgi:hypothetical protein
MSSTVMTLAGSSSAVRSHRQAPQQGKDQQNQPKHTASRAENGIPAPEAVASARQRQEQNHDEDK